jgi:GntR family transcriptional repressor for pyruvate dehydrogenase complex
MYEARRILEVGAAGLSAERATPEQIASMADEVAGLFAALNDPQGFLVHDIKFHRAVAAASGNPIVTSLVEMVSELYYERRRQTAARATDRNLRDAAEMHQRVYRAIRMRDPKATRRAMNEHLVHSSAYQTREAAGETAPAPVETERSAGPGTGGRPARRKYQRRRTS